MCVCVCIKMPTILLLNHIKVEKVHIFWEEKKIHVSSFALKVVTLSQGFVFFFFFADL